MSDEREEVCEDCGKVHPKVSFIDLLYMKKFQELMKTETAMLAARIDYEFPDAKDFNFVIISQVVRDDDEVDVMSWENCTNDALGGGVEFVEKALSEVRKAKAHADQAEADSIKEKH